MPVQKVRTSASKRNTRRSHHGLKVKGLSFCPSCGEAKLSHTVCPNCGTYRGKVVIEPKATTDWEGEDFKVEG